MRIAFITSHINKSFQWNWFSEELIKRKIEHIHIVINEYQPIMVKDMKRMDVPVYYLWHGNIFSHIFNLLRIIRILRRHKIDLIHTELPYGNLLGQWAARLLGIQRRVATCENATWAAEFNSSKHAFIDRFAYRTAKRVITLTHLSIPYLSETYKLNADKLISIGHAVKLEDYADVDDQRINKLKEEMGVEDGDFVLGMVARLEHWKGHMYVIEALHKLANDHPELKLLIVGSDGPEREPITSKIAEYNLQEKVAYHGFIDDPVALYRLFDIHVHVPTTQMAETFGITVIEGMLSGCAQILTRSGIAHFTAKHEENGLVVDFKNSDAIAEAIVRLKQDPGLRQRLADQARADAIKDWGYETKVDRHMEVYEGL